MALKNVADEYFSKINSIASRIYVDMNETKTDYEDLWLTLSEEDKNQILNESIIKPEISVRYSEPRVRNKKKSEYAVKLVVDDNYSYRDEHSAPFSFRTPSQRNLSIFTTNVDRKQPAKSSKSKEGPKPIAPVKLRSSKSKEPVTAPLIELKTEEDAPSPSVDESLSSIPKTGLDLLDNW